MATLHTNAIDVETWEEAQFLARLNYELALGAEFLSNNVVVYIDDNPVDLPDPTRVRLDRTEDSDVVSACDEYLDPNWDITILDGTQGESAWTYGPSYRVLEAVR